MLNFPGTILMTQCGRVEITSGEPFRIEFAGKLQLTRMEFRHSPRCGYYTVDGYPLRDGLRAAIGERG